MKVLIGITSKNRAPILPKAIDSALRQTHQEKEIWVYDDASTDSTKSLQNSYQHINWIFSDTPFGYLHARNLFMKKPGFNYFCSLDDDAWFIKDDSIEKAISFMQNNPDVGVVGFDMLSPDAPEKKTDKPFFKETNNFIGCGHIVNLTAAEEVGYYTRNPGFYGGEEKDLCIKLIDAGYRIMTYKGEYVWHDKTMVARDLKKQHQSGVCNDLVFTYRRAPLSILLPALPIKLFKHLKFSIRYKKEQLVRPCLLGIVDFFKWLATEKTNRKAVSRTAFHKFINLGKS